MSSSTDTPPVIGATGLTRSSAADRWAVARERWPQWWPWAPVLCASIYAIVVLINFSPLITAINMQSDASIALMMGKLLGSVPHGATAVLGDHPWYEPLWFLRATSWLPGYRLLWEVAPAAWTVAGIGVLAWSTSRALGRWAAALTACALICRDCRTIHVLQLRLAWSDCSPRRAPRRDDGGWSSALIG